MRQDEHPLSPIAGGAVVEPPGDIGRAPLLPAFENQSAHLAGRSTLRLELLVDETLRPIEHERRDRARLGADVQVLGSKKRIISVGSYPGRSPLRCLLDYDLEELQRRVIARR